MVKFVKFMVKGGIRSVCARIVGICQPWSFWTCVCVCVCVSTSKDYIQNDVLLLLQIVYSIRIQYIIGGESEFIAMQRDVYIYIYVRVCRVSFEFGQKGRKNNI